MERLIGVDVGGTFTDIVVMDDEGLTSHKVPTSVNQAEGVVSAVEGDHEDVFLHGTTAATNALLEERGAIVGLVTDAGYEDLIEIGRQDRPSLYDSNVDRPQPLVARDVRWGHTGDTAHLIDSMSGSRCEIVAVGLIESYSDPSEEEALVDELASALRVPVVSSSGISPEFREYERLATTVLSAYLTPSVASYLELLGARLPMAKKLVMTSSGGMIPFEQGPSAAGRLVLSGPAGGVVAAAALGRAHGCESVLSFDMGGTSTDVCRITNGDILVGSGHDVAGRVNRVPSVPIRTIGAGGGSVGWIDPGGALRVGPRSSGAMPGPACYGRGGVEPSVTDANLVVGNIPSDVALGGTVTLDVDAARTALSTLREATNLNPDDAARGMIEVVESHMEHALRSVSVEEGADPREAVLVAFGGAGGLHAVRLARRLGMRKVLIPPLSGVFSALGLMMASRRSDAARTVMLAEHDPRLEARLTEVAQQSSQSYGSTFGHRPVEMLLSADVRYVGQSHELEVIVDPNWSNVRDTFERSHLQMFGFSRQQEPIEVVNVRAVATGDPPVRWSDLPKLASRAAPRGRDDVWERKSLPAGFTLEGRALVIEANSAVLVETGSALTVLDDGTLEITP